MRIGSAEKWGKGRKIAIPGCIIFWVAGDGPVFDLRPSSWPAVSTVWQDGSRGEVDIQGSGLGNFGFWSPASVRETASCFLCFPFKPVLAPRIVSDSK